MVLTCDWDWTQQLVVPPVTIRAPDHGMIAVIAPALITTTARSTKDAELHNIGRRCVDLNYYSEVDK